MHFFWAFIVIIVLYQIIKWSAKTIVTRQAPDNMDQLIADTNTLATIMSLGDRARRANHFVKQIANEDGSFADEDKEMTARLTFFYLSIDVLRSIHPDQRELIKEVKEVNWSNVLNFQNKLHQLISNELEEIVNA